MAKFWTRDDILPKHEVVLYEGKTQDNYSGKTEIIVTLLRILLIGDTFVSNFYTKDINAIQMNGNYAVSFKTPQDHVCIRFETKDECLEMYQALRKAVEK